MNVLHLETFANKKVRATLVFLFLGIVLLSLTFLISYICVSNTSVNVFGTKTYSPTQSTYAPGQVIVKFKTPLQTTIPFSTTKQSIAYKELKPKSVPQSLALANNSFTVASIQKLFPNDNTTPLSKIYSITFNTKDSIKIVNHFKNRRNQKDVEYADLNYKIEFFNDPLFGQQWHLNNESDIDVDALETFDLSAYGVEPKKRDIVVAIVDRTLKVDHPDLFDSVWTNTDEVEGDGIDNDNNGYIDDVYGCYFFRDMYGVNRSMCKRDEIVADNDTHGTSVGGVVGATHNNGIGVKGICPNCKIMRVGLGGFFDEALIGMRYAVDNGAHVINMSWGYWGDSIPALVDVLNYAHSKGVVLVAAAGNAGTYGIARPAREEYVIGVASIDSSNMRASTSSYGEQVDLSAPGHNVLTTYHQTRNPNIPNTYMIMTGTSFASPVVAGTAGMLLSYNPGLTTEQVEAVMRETADPIVNTSEFLIGKMGAGRVNGFKALYKMLSLKDVFKATTVAAVQCFGNNTRLEIRDKSSVKINGAPAEHIIDNVFHGWVENGTTVAIGGTGSTINFVVPTECKTSTSSANF